MSIWILLLLAIVQGLTEFLPVSSSGHLVLLYDWFGIEDGTILLSVLMHIATLFSVLIYYRKEVIQLVLHPLCNTNRKMLVTTIVTCGVVLLIKPLIDKMFGGAYLFVFFLITAILLFVSDYMAERKGLMSRTSGSFRDGIVASEAIDITDIGVSYRQAIIIGLTQGVACIPGISRSGSTIAVGRIVGAKDVTKYSFLISIPIIIASLIMELVSGGSLAGGNVVALIFAMIICFFVGLLCIRVMTKIVNNNRLTIFAYYLIGLSIVLIVLGFVR